MTDVSPAVMDNWAFGLNNMDNHDREGFAHAAKSLVHPSSSINLTVLRRELNGRVQGQGHPNDRMDSRVGIDLKNSAGNSRPGGSGPASLRAAPASSSGSSSSSSSSSGSRSSSSKSSDSVIDLSDLSGDSSAYTCSLTDQGKALRKRILEYFSTEFVNDATMEVPDELVGSSEEEPIDPKLASVINAMARASANVETTIARLRNAKRQK